VEKIDFWEKNWFLRKHLISDKTKIYFWQTFWFKQIFKETIWFLRKNLIFVKKFDFWEQFWFLRKNLIFVKKFDFWEQFWFFTKNWFLTKISLTTILYFWHNFDFWHEFRFLIKSFDFWKKGLTWQSHLFLPGSKNPSSFSSNFRCFGLFFAFLLVFSLGRYFSGITNSVSSCSGFFRATLLHPFPVSFLLGPVEASVFGLSIFFGFSTFFSSLKRDFCSEIEKFY